jgi:HEAT repeat protein
MKKPRLVGLMIIAICCARIVYAQEPAVFDIEKLIAGFSSTDSLSRRIAFDEFDKTVSPSERATVLSDMWERVQQTKQHKTRLTILAYLTDPHPGGTIFNDRLRNHILEAGNDPDPDMKRLVINVLVEQKSADTRSRLLRFLQDEDDDIREAAITEISRWDDSESILKKYVATNQGRKERTSSVRKARFFLSKQKPKNQRQKPAKNQR